MQTPVALLRLIGKAVLNAVGGGVAGDLAVDVLPEIAHDLWAWYRRNPDKRQAELLALAEASPVGLRQAVHEAVAEVAGDQPAAIRLALTRFLAQVPAALRQSLRCSARSPAESVPFLFSLERLDDVLSLLPSRLARFQPGDRPLPGIDWELVELLGTGGFGEVWKARNPHFDGVPPVALKFCLDPGAKDRLLRHEAAVLNQVMRHGKHPGIVALQHTYLSADPPCLEYEFVEGGNLGGLIREWHRSPPGPHFADRAARLMLQLARIVAVMHRLKPPVVHRDLKPANILVEPGEDGQFALRVADFGIGGIAAGYPAVSARGQLLATALRGAHTPLYASPQQTRGEPPDPRDDVHALGIIWYQLMTGSLSAGRPSGPRWAKQLADQGMSRGLIDLLGSCVEEKPDDRPADAADLADELEMRADARGLPCPRRDLPSQVVNSVGMKLVLLPGGSFQMGSPASEAKRGDDEGPARPVTLEMPFYLGVHPTTQREYQTVMGGNPAQFCRGNGGDPNHPVEQVSWEEAVAFCRRLSNRPEERRAGRRYRLPTEAEWEYACRAGTITPFFFGRGLSAEQANFDGRHPYGKTKPGPYLQRTTPVGSYPPNAYGLYDMHGNVWEWCADWYDEASYWHGPPRDPQGPAEGKRRIVRGGSWNNSGHLCRSARRGKYSPDFRGDTIGFRVVLEVG